MSLKHTSRTPAACAIVIALIATRLASGQVWDLTNDWSDDQNPNGVWSYNAGNAAIPTNWPNWAGVQPAWAAAETGFGHIPTWGKTQVDIGCELGLGDVFTHANDGGNGNDVDLANVTWTSPVGGVAAVTGNLWWFVGDRCCGGHCGRTMDWRLYFNDELMDFGNIGDGDEWDRDNPRTFGFVTCLQEGDVLKLEFERTSTFGTMAGIHLTVSILPCLWDLDANGSVGASDLLSLLGSWGPCKCCPADFDENGTVGASDLLALLANWGPCP